MLTGRVLQRAHTKSLLLRVEGMLWHVFGIRRRMLERSLAEVHAVPTEARQRRRQEGGGDAAECGRWAQRNCR
jgi:hypothetical protein